MAKAPDERLIKFSDDEATRLIKLYEQAENDLLKEINRCLLKGNQTKYLKAMLQNTQVILDDLRQGSRDWCEKSIPRVYIEGAKAADMQMKAQGEEVIAGFGTVHQQAAKVLADSAFNRFDDVTNMIGRRVDDIYRKIALENIRASAIGYQSWQKVARNYRQQLADEGVTGFTDRAGKKWDMSTYSKMVARTTTMESHLEGTKTRLLENGHDLVQISKHSSPCKLCAPWEGKIVSLSGNDKDYPSMDDATAAGLFHPNCRHAYGLYIDIDAEIAKMEGELAKPTARDYAVRASNIEDELKDKGIKINTFVSESSGEKMYKAYSTIDNVLSDFPKTRIKKIEFMEEYTQEYFASMSKSGVLELSKALKTEDIAELEGMLKADLFITTNSPIEAVVAHEMGHGAFNALVYLDDAEAIHNKLDGVKYRSIAAYEKARAQKIIDSVKSKDALSELGKYAMSDPEEAIAEAFADVYSNGTKAKKIAKEIVAEMDRLSKVK